MTNFLSRLWPQSLYRQLLLVVALALLVAQGISAALLMSMAQSRAIAEAATLMAGRVVSHAERQLETGRAVDNFVPRKGEGPRAGWLYHNRQRILIFPDRISPDGYKPQKALARRANEYFSQSAADIGDVSFSVGPVAALPPELVKTVTGSMHARHMRKIGRPLSTQAVLMSARLPDGRWIHAVSLLRSRDRAAVWALLLQTFTLYIAVLIPLALIARRIVRPLEKLRRRVGKLGVSGEAEPLESEGPADIRSLIDSFNTMQSRVMALLNEKDVMLGAIGHDLKTPLAALRVRIESVDNDAEREKMAAIIDEMAMMMDDILMLARLGKSGEAPQKVNLNALVDDIASEFQDRGRAVAFDPEAGDLVAPVRPVLIRRALRNIVDNAVKYGKSAHISAMKVDGRIRIIVDDEGPGIADDMMEQMFEPFMRAERSRNRDTGGSGLGLTIARAIVRSHGGEILPENRAGGGLRIMIDLPSE